MISLLLIALLQPQDLRVEGLRDGEGARRLTPAPALDDDAPDAYQRGRVLDATTGYPVAGATVETWTEENDRLAPGFHRVGAATSGVDGGFRVRIREGALRGEKVRASADGYLATPGVVYDLKELLLFPRAELAPVLRVVDLEGRGIPQALVTTTYSCAHDVPAFVDETDALGIARLDAWGFQDRTPQLRLRAEGFGAWKYLDLDQVLAGHNSTRMDDPRGLALRPFELRLARRAPFGARLVDPQGRPVPGAALHVVDGPGFHVVRTDEDGRFRVASPYWGHGPTIFLLGSDRQRHVFSGRLPRGRTVNLSTPGGELAGEAPLARLAIELPPMDTDAPGVEDAPRLVLQLFHDSGWNDEASVSEDDRCEFELPAGECLLSIGGAFSGWEQQLVPLELAPNEERALRLEPRREPRLAVLTPEDDGARLVVQVGDDSVEPHDDGKGRVELSVPRGGRVVVLREGADVRRAVLPEATDGAVVDLREASCVVESARGEPEAEPVALEVLAFDTAGEPLDGSLSVRGPGWLEVESSGPGRYSVDAHAGADLGLFLHAPGHAALWTVLRAHRSGSPLELRPTPLASLSIESEFDLALEGPWTDQLDALHPGPLELVLSTPDGRRLGISLELQPAEHRTLVVR